MNAYLGILCICVFLHLIYSMHISIFINYVVGPTKHQDTQFHYTKSTQNLMYQGNLSHFSTSNKSLFLLTNHLLRLYVQKSKQFYKSLSYRKFDNNLFIMTCLSFRTFL